MESAMQTAMPIMDQAGAILGEPGHRRTPPAPFDLLEQYGATVTLRRGQTIYAHDQPAEFCWRMVTGCARTVTLMEDGRRHVGGFLWPDDLLGMDDLTTYYADAEAVTEVTLRRYLRAVVEAHAENHVHLAMWLRMMTTVSLRSAQRQIVALGRKTAAERIAAFLLQMDRRAGPRRGKLVVLPMSRTDIADHLGLSIETVCRNLVQLQRGGAVKILRSGIELCDRLALQDLASE